MAYRAAHKDFLRPLVKISHFVTRPWYVGPGGKAVVTGDSGHGPPLCPWALRRSEDQPKWVLTPSSPNIAPLITMSPPAGMPAAPQGCLPSFGATRLSKRLLPRPAGMCLWHRNALCSLAEPLQAKPCRVPSPGHRAVPASWDSAVDSDKVCPSGERALQSFYRQSPVDGMAELTHLLFGKCQG